MSCAVLASSMGICMSTGNLDTGLLTAISLLLVYILHASGYLAIWFLVSISGQDWVHWHDPHA